MSGWRPEKRESGEGGEEKRGGGGAVFSAGTQ